MEPSKGDVSSLRTPDTESMPPPPKSDLQEEGAAVVDIMKRGAGQVIDGTQQSLVDNLTSEENNNLLKRLRNTVSNLCQRADYSNSVSTITLFIRRYLLIYSHALSDTAQVVAEDVDTNPETDHALKNLWLLLSSLGNRSEWDDVERIFNQLVKQSRDDPQFDELIRQISNLIQDMLTNIEFFDNPEERFSDFRVLSQKLAHESSIKEHLDALLSKLRLAFYSGLQDSDIEKLLSTTGRILKILSPNNQYTNEELISDAINVFVPLFVTALQFVPIPRLEVSTPDIDLLLENLILTPGHTVNNSSFLPFKLNISTHNDVEIRKARFRTTSLVSTSVRLSLSGLSVSAEDIGHWVKLHSGVLRFSDTGIAGFRLDERGIDICVDLEVGKDRIEDLITLHKVHVNIHQLNFDLRQSKLACLVWLLKPLIRPLVKRALEAKISQAISDALHYTNRELVFARERLCAARIANPRGVFVFLRAVTERLAPAQDPDVSTRVGFAQPGYGVFKDVYAPGSLVKLWNEEAGMASHSIHEYKKDGWKNGIFDVQTVRL
jgi:hypothetical protein